MNAHIQQNERICQVDQPSMPCQSPYLTAAVARESKIYYSTFKHLIISKHQASLLILYPSKSK